MMSVGEMIEDDFVTMWKFRDEDVHGHRFKHEEVKRHDDGVSSHVKRRHTIWDLDKLFTELKPHWDNHLHGIGVCPESGQKDNGP